MKRKILLIDDDDAILDALSLFLIEMGYKVTAINNDQDAYSTALQLMPDIIFLDILMSGKDGRDICKTIKKDKRLKKIPIIMMSAHPSAKHESSTYEAEGFLAKPFDSRDIIQCIEKYTSNSIQ